jgi:hypothetical protein
MEKRILKIDLDELCNAMEDSSYEHEYYLDLETGEILFISEYMDDKETEELRDRVEEDFDRYEQISRVESHEAYGDMVDFLSTINNEHLAELLEVAIDGKGAFRRFQNVLIDYPEERERWFKFKGNRTKERVLEWLNDINVIASDD